MNPKILQVNFKLAVPAGEWEQIAASLVEPFVDMPGLRWKVWLLNEEVGEAGGIYLFESESALQAFLAGPIPAQLQSAPFQRELSVKIFDIMDDVSARTHAPVREYVAAQMGSAPVSGR